MVDPKKLYRVRPERRGIQFITSKELFTSIFVEQSAPRPERRHAPVSEWYCGNDECDVRRVRIDLLFTDGHPPRRLPAMTCPACGQQMQFCGYLKDITLVPAEAP